MRKFLLFLILGLPVIGFAQTPNATPAATPPPQRTPTPQPVATPNRNTDPDYNRIVDPLKYRKEVEEWRKLEESKKLAEKAIRELYRKPNRSELLFVAVEQDLYAKYSSFLQKENTGLIRLLNNSECSENQNLLSATENCTKFTMPGAGSSYSFRQNSYRIPRLADITLKDDSIKATGEWLHGLFVEIGDIPLESVYLQTLGLDFLGNFQAANEQKLAQEIDFRLAKGIQNGGFMYRRSLKYQEYMTYVLRSIAYRGNLYRSIEGYVYNELDYDKRKDIIVALRVVRKYPDGSIAILWKRLSLKDSPKIVKETPPDNPKKIENRFVAKASN